MSKVYTIKNNSSVSPDNDVTSGLVSQEELFGTDGTDVYFGYTGNDKLRGGSGDDFLAGEVGNDTLSGDAGDDFLFYADNRYYDSGYVQNFAGPGSVIGNELDRQFLEDEWYDVFNVNQTADGGTDLSISGGDGFDTAVIDLSFSASPLTATFVSGGSFKLPNGTTNVSGIEAFWVRGGNGNDNYTGGDNDDRLNGGGGDDVLKGGGGNDFLFGGTGSDDMDGGDGNDFIVSTDYFAQFLRGNNQLTIDYIAGLAQIYQKTSVSPQVLHDTIIEGGNGIDTVVIDFEGNAAPVNFELKPDEFQNLPELDTQIHGVEAMWVIDSAGDDDISAADGDFDDHFLSIGGSDTFDGKGGIDTYELSTFVVDADVNLATGQAGSDTLHNFENVIGSSGVNVLTGNAAANTLYGRGGNDTLKGGDGDDILDGGAGADALNGGAGEDTASYASSAGRVKVDLINSVTNEGDAQGDTYISIENIVGSRRGDTLLGNNSNNRIDGGLGRDNIQGRDGNDTFIASANNDSFNGGDGSDTIILSGMRSDYTIVATGSGFTIQDKRGASFDGTDTVVSVETFVFSDQTRTSDTLINVNPSSLTFNQSAPLREDAQAGTLVGTLSATDADGDPLTFTLDAAGSALFTRSGNQLLLKSGANIDFDTSTGGASTRTFEVTVTDGQGGSTTVTFELEITNDASDDIIRGDDGNNTLKGTSGDDHIMGLAGNDKLFGGQGGDRLDGGSGTDTASYSDAAKAVVASLRDPSSNTGDAKRDVYKSIENLTGTGFSDKLTGNKFANTLNGSSGNDTLTGAGGADRLIGGSGNDTASYSTASKGVTVNLSKTSSNTGDAKGDSYSSIENLGGSNFSDKLTGNGSDNSLKGYSGNDTLVGGGGEDDLYGGSGKDSFVFTSVNDLSKSKSATDTIFDFSRSQGDKIDFSGMDSNVKVGGNQAFSFIGTQSFHKKAGELRFVKESSDTYIYGDRNGDGKSDFVLHLDDAIKLVKGDFIL